jgi:NTE family protein
VERPPDDLALVLPGGGARAAYQVGVLRHLARRYPDLAVPVLTGVSAGAINAAYLASRPESFPEKVEGLAELWGNLRIEDVFRVDAWSLLGHVVRWAFQLGFLGGVRGAPRVHGFLDTKPLEGTLARVLRPEFGKLVGIQENVRRERLRAVGLVTTDYSTGQTITWCEGKKIEAWERPMRRAIVTTLSTRHVMASAALPMFFPAIPIGNDYYGDGGVRLHAPLAPAIHLGASRILAISNHYRPTQADGDRRFVDGYPPPAQVIGVLMNAIFLDLLDQDALELQRINRLIGRIPEHERDNLRPVELLVIRPSRDLGALAGEYEVTLPRLFRFLTRRLGTKETRSSDLVSLLLFEPAYLRRLIELGEEDAEARAGAIERFLAG